MNDRARRSVLVLARELRGLCPTVVPTSVRFTELAPDVNGTCQELRTRNGDLKGFRICISTSLGRDFAHHILVHEWAHALSWSAEHPTVNDHGPEFGLAYARVYQATIGA